MLTGKISWRQNWRGKIIIMVQKKYPGMFAGDWNYKWKDATIKDLAQIGISQIIYKRNDNGQ